MAQKLLNGAEIGAAFQQVGREAVAEGVGAGVLAIATCLTRDARIFARSDPSAAHRGLRNRARSGAGPERTGRYARSASRGPRSEGNDPLLPAFTEDTEHAGIEVHLGKVQTHELRAPDSVA